jgi:hypothetical protein
VVSKRVLYTTNTLVKFPINTFVGLTSRTPYFIRDDVADRLVVFSVKRFGAGQYLSENELTARIVKDRNRILTAVVRDLQECLAALKQTAARTYHTSLRMADFGVFCLRLADAKGEADDVEEIFTKLGEDQDALTLEDDTLIDLLLLWLSAGHEGQAVTSAQLHAELSRLADLRDMAFVYQSGRSLGQRLRNVESNLGAVVDMEIRKEGHAHLRVYRFWLRCNSDGSNASGESRRNRSPGDSFDEAPF